MENNIILPNNNFDFDNITVLSPSTIQGKTFLSKIQNENGDLYIQTPKCTSKNAFVTSGKKTYIDLLFEKDNDVFIEWFENLENKIQQEIYKKRERWFRGENIEKSDIEDIFTSPIKTYKSGKYYCIRVNLGSPRVIQHIPLNIFDENENQLDMDDIQPNTKMITILQLHGLKFNVNINFQIYIELKQILVIDEEKMFKKPLFKTNKPKQQVDNNVKVINNTLEEVDESMKEEINTEPYKESDTVSDFKVETDQIQKTEQEQETIQETEKESEKETENEEIADSQTNLESSIKADSIVETEPLISTEAFDDLEDINEVENNNEIDSSNSQSLLKNTNDNNLEEYNPDLLNISDTFTIKKPDDVYMELYKTAKEKAKNARLDAIKAYMELKHIKQNYQIDDLDSDNDFSESEFQSSDEESENEEDNSPKLDFVELS